MELPLLQPHERVLDDEHSPGIERTQGSQLCVLTGAVLTELKLLHAYGVILNELH